MISRRVVHQKFCYIVINSLIFLYKNHIVNLGGTITILSIIIKHRHNVWGHGDPSRTLKYTICANIGNFVSFQVVFHNFKGGSWSRKTNLIFFSLKYSLTCVEYETTVRNSNDKLTYQAFFEAGTTTRSRRAVDFNRVFLKTMFSGMTCSINQNLINWSTWNWKYLKKIWLSSIWISNYLKGWSKNFLSFLLIFLCEKSRFFISNKNANFELELFFHPFI